MKLMKLNPIETHFKLLSVKHRDKCTDTESISIAQILHEYIIISKYKNN